MDNLQPSRIVGGNSLTGRRESDFYPTPPDATIALVDYIKPSGIIWEPACGAGNMAKAIEGCGNIVIATDINDFGYGKAGIDFLQCECMECDWIITNPPFGLAADFISRCAEHGIPFALLMKAHFWNAAKRYQLFQDITPSHVLPLTWRPDFTGKGAALLDMAWYVWDLNGNDTIFVPLRKPNPATSNTQSTNDPE